MSPKRLLNLLTRASNEEISRKELRDVFRREKNIYPMYYDKEKQVFERGDRDALMKDPAGRDFYGIENDKGDIHLVPSVNSLGNSKGFNAAFVRHKPENAMYGSIVTDAFDITRSAKLGRNKEGNYIVKSRGTARWNANTPTSEAAIVDKKADKDLGEKEIETREQKTNDAIDSSHIPNNKTKIADVGSDGKRESKQATRTIQTTNPLDPADVHNPLNLPVLADGGNSIVPPNNKIIAAGSAGGRGGGGIPGRNNLPQVAERGGGGGGGSDKNWWDKYHMTTLVGLGTLGAAALAASSAFGGPMSNSQLYADPLGGY